jgi:3-hydroxyisobutyrate dehydrogenase-like beta-hydroxyacid dehydrogenase
MGRANLPAAALPLYGAIIVHSLNPHDGTCCCGGAEFRMNLKRKVAFLGLGLMGVPMAARLVAAGFPVAVWNRSPGKSAVLLAAGATEAPTPADAAAEAEWVCLCLTNAAAVQQVVFGRNGVIERVSPEATLIDFSTIGVKAAASYAARLAALTGARWLDAPVSGGVNGARSGRLIVFCGGSSTTLEAARPLLAVLSVKATRLGAPGAGQAAKLCNQLIVSANLAAIAEALSLGRSLGIDVGRLPEALAGGFADSQPLQIFGPRMASTQLAPTLGQIGAMREDVLQICQVAASGGMDLPLLAAVETIYRRAEEMGLSNEDIGRLAEMYRRLNPPSGS